MRWHRMVLVATVGVGVVAPGTAPAATAVKHAISQHAGTAGCVAARAKGCAIDAAVRGLSDVAVTDDGRTVLATSVAGDALLVFARTPSTGSVRRTACFSLRSAAGCHVQPGLDGASAVAVAPSGRDVYVASRDSGTVLQFRRGADRALTYVGCVGATAASGCASVQGRLAGVDDLDVADDGRALVATVEGTGDPEDAAGAGVVSLARSALDGTPTPAGCLAVTGSAGCPDGAVLAEAPTGPAAVAPHGRNVYLPGEERLQAVRIQDGARLTAGRCFTQERRPACGRIAHLGTLAPDGTPGGLSALALSPDGRYLTSSGFDGVLPLDPIALLVHAVAPATGTLASAGCLRISANEEVRSRIRGCRPGRPPLNGPGLLEVSPDGRRMAAADTAYALVSLLVRNPASGDLGRVSTKAGCIGGTDAAFGDDALKYPHSSCAQGRGFASPTGLAWSPDGRDLYVATERSLVTLRAR